MVWIVKDKKRVINTDFIIEVRKGNVPGHRIIDVTGQSDSLPTLVPQDVWGINDNLVYPTSEEQWEIDFSNPQDSITGTGIRSLTTFYQNRLFESKSVSYDSNGGIFTIPVTDSYRHIETVATSWGSTPFAQGEIIIADSVSKLPRSQIAPGGNSSRDLHYTIPTGHSGTIIFAYVDVTKGDDARAELQATIGDQQTNPGFFGLFPVSVYQSSFALGLRTGTKRLVEGSDLKVVGVSSNNSTLSGSIQILEIKNNFVNLELS